MKRFKGYLVILLLLFTTGCATVALPALSGMGFAVHYSQSNVASKTFTFPVDQTDKATMFALKGMGIKVVDDSTTEKGKRIKAATDELDIIIDLEQVTAKVTKVNVNARKWTMIKDMATASEIIAQVAKALEIIEKPENVLDFLTRWSNEKIYPQNK
ncbi:MAG TPA: DUF3568 family protein [Anaerolineae bacterium]|nr:DUF3568 family protein [Anaerolineae bacterium]